MGVSIFEGPKYGRQVDAIERLASAFELMVINQSGEAQGVANWRIVQNIVRSGLGPKAFPVGSQFVVERETSLSAAMGVHTGITAVTVNEETFLAAEGIVGTGVHEFVFDGSVWVYNGQPVRLTDFGLTVEGTAADGDEIIVTEAFNKIVWDVVGHPDDSNIPVYVKKAYAKGEQVQQDGYVWVCMTAIASPGEDWDSTHWTQLHRAGEPRMVLLMHHVIYSRVFDAPEALIYAENEIPAGTYHVGDGAATPTYYQFTLASAVPAGGQIVVASWPSSGYVLTGRTIKTYSGPTSTTEIESATVSEGSGGADLGTFGEGNVNNVTRARYGSNNYKESALRQWINSASAADSWWKPTNVFDRPVGYANAAGLLHGMDADFLAVVGKTKVPCKTNNTFELPDWTLDSPYVLEDKFFLASRDELGYGKERVQEGYVFELYNGAADVERMKYDLSAQTTARTWRHRSPLPGSAYYVRYTLSTTGALGSSYALSGDGAAAACEIK